MWKGPGGKIGAIHIYYLHGCVSKSGGPQFRGPALGGGLRKTGQNSIADKAESSRDAPVEVVSLKPI